MFNTWWKEHMNDYLVKDTGYTEAEYIWEAAMEAISKSKGSNNESTKGL